MARRGVWTGSISFGLVSVGVKALTAVHDHDVHFHQLERGTGARVGNQKVSKESGEPVDADDIEMGYEVSKGRYVTFDRSEIDELRPESTRHVDVTDFVDLAEIDPVYYQRTYWLAPTDDGAEHAYRLLAAAMEETQQVGIGTVVMRNKQYLTAIRPLDGVLAMSTMRFADEVVAQSEISELPSRRSKPEAKAVRLATQIVDSLASDWDPSQYHDTFTEELKERILAKDRGDEVVEEEGAPPASADVADLMAALEASVAKAKEGGRSRTAKRKRRGPSKSTAKRTSKQAGTRASAKRKSA